MIGKLQEHLKTIRGRRMPTQAKPQQYILLPIRGLHSTTAFASESTKRFFAERSVMRGGPSRSASDARSPARWHEIDSIGEDGAKLVEMSPDSLPALRVEQPGLKIVPVVYYRPAVAPRFAVESRPQAAAGKTAAKIKLKIVSKKDGRPVAGAVVVAFIDFADRIGAQGTTNSKGEVSLMLGATSKRLQRIYIYPEKNFWSALKKNITVTSGTQLALEPVALTFADALRYFHGAASDQIGAGVKVAVIDTGIDTHHPDLEVAGGANTVVGENENDFGDNGMHHGTHVAGIIAARGKPPLGLRGLAPAITLQSYRVFGKNSGEASNYAIIKAIDRAVADGCDLINMSLGGGRPDEATMAAIEDARSQGSVVIVAAGNDDRSPVSFPASYSLALAISAMGRKGTFPQGTTEAGDVAAPYGKDKKNFVAAFSNIGPEIDLTGPGVGILSTVPGGYAPMSGTSMACPAVTGLAARLLSKQTKFLNMQRSQARSDAMFQAILQAAKSLGFGPRYEGQGMLNETE
jgi:subtilisin